MDPLSARLRSRLSPALWERAAAWAAAGGARRASQSATEEVWLVTVPGQKVSFEVTLWPADPDHACSCELEVCAHAAAACLARASGVVLTAEVPRVRYRLVRHGQALAIERDAPPEAIRGAHDSELNRILGGWWGKPTVPKGLLAMALGQLRAAPVTLDGAPVPCDGAPVLPRVLIDDRDRGWVARLVRASGITEAFTNGAVRIDGTIRPIGSIDLDPVLHQRLLQGLPFGPEEVERLVTEFLPKLRALVPVEVRSARLPDARALAPRLEWEVRGDGGHVRAVARVVYGDPPVARVERGQLVRIGGPIVIRDLAAEARLAASLSEEAGMSPGVPVERDGIGAPLWADGLRGGAREVVLAASPGLRIDRTPIDPSVRVTTDGDGFRVSVESGGVGAEGLLAAWEARAGLVPMLGGGWRPVPREWLERHGPMLAELLSAADGAGRLSRQAAPMVLDALDALGAQIPESLNSLRALAGQFDAIPAVPLPPTFVGRLRPYQQRGVDWIRWLASVGMGGVLADDMGLGKTVQCLAAIAVGGGRTLVVAPTSVLRNWAAEAARFVPSLRVSVYHGARRALDPDADLVVTTWAILRLDQEALAAVSWTLAIFDEAQAMKNPESQVAQAARRIQADVRLAVTGTPVENRLEELWSLFHLVNPGLLGGRRAFKDRFSAPIEAGHRGARESLRKRIRPFVLRRLKREVATDLPPRTDVVLRCTLSEEERQVYESVRALGRADVAKLLGSGGYLQVLEVLLRMRQASCATALVGRPLASSKLALLLGELEEILADPADGHRALVFSQWTSLLDLVEPELDARGIRYVRLDGSTVDRAGVVAAFNAPDGPPVFLLSLTAGGTGLNLVAADYVFLLDPWWNPAVEDQATDRAHRIGQTRPVVACRLVAEDTVEERILELQARKRDLARAALDDVALARALGRDDLLALFA